MAKFKVCVIKTIKLFEHFEINAENDMQARSLAINEAKKAELLGLEIRWSEEEKPIYKAEVVR